MNTANKRSLVPANLVHQAKGFWERRVVCDLHGVIAEWRKPFCSFASRTLGREIDPNATSLYNFCYDRRTGISPVQMNELFTQFARLGTGGYGELQPDLKVIEGLKAIAASGVDVQIITWTPGASEISLAHNEAYGAGTPAQGATLELIKRFVSEYGLPVDPREVLFMSPGSKQWHMAEEQIPVIIEDCAKTAIGVANEVGGVGILIPHEYNKGISCPGVTRLRNRSELAPTVLQVFKTLDEAGVLL